MAAEKAALLMSGTAASDLISLVNSVTAEDSIEAIVENDLEFHHRIAVASGNAVLCSLADSVANRTHRARIFRGVTQGDSFAQTRREHLAIAHAISNRQPSIAAACALAHVAGIESWLRSNLGTLPPTLHDHPETSHVIR
jgi:DNA-binding FadR family transcriptional regulator